MDAEPGALMRCPTCGARQEWSDACRRCRSDLRLLRTFDESARAERIAALRALAAGRADAALGHARRHRDLRPGPEADRLLAACAAVAGDWATAAALANAADPPPNHGALP